MSGPDPRPLLEDQDGPLVWRDPDPLRPDDTDQVYADGFVAGVAHGLVHDRRRRDRLAGLALIAAVVALLIVAFAAGRASAAPRSGQTTERVDVSAPSSAALSGAPRDGMPVEAAAEASRVAAAPAAGVGAPSPDVELGTAIEGGLASWCAPTPDHCQSWGGDAHLAAMPSFTYGDRPFQVIVRYRDKLTRVTVVSFCACSNRVIDLSPSAFDDLAPLGLGVIPVTVEWPGPNVTPPATDVDP